MRHYVIFSFARLLRCHHRNYNLQSSLRHPSKLDGCEVRNITVFRAASMLIILLLYEPAWSQYYIYTRRHIIIMLQWKTDIRLSSVVIAFWNWRITRRNVCSRPMIEGGGVGYNLATTATLNCDQNPSHIKWTVELKVVKQVL